MKCDFCNCSMSQFEYDCFEGLCDNCHEKLVKENIDFLKECEDMEND